MPENGMAVKAMADIGISENGLACQGLSFRHAGERPLFDGLDVAFNSGEAVLITGNTGVGKSTLLHLLAGLLHPGAGRISADGQPVSLWRSRHKDVWRRQVGIVFQQLHLMDGLTVLENVIMPLVASNASWSQCIVAAAPFIDTFDLVSLARTPVKRLSGGQRQRVALARAMVNKPRFLLLDEPSAFQDAPHTRSLLALLADQAAQGVCVVVCSHDDRLISATACFDRLWTLTGGHLVPRSGPDAGSGPP